MLCCAVLCYSVLCCAVLCWAGLGWAGLGWAGLGWAGLGWAGLGCAVLCCAGLCWAVLGCAVPTACRYLYSCMLHCSTSAMHVQKLTTSMIDLVVRLDDTGLLNAKELFCPQHLKSVVLAPSTASC